MAQKAQLEAVAGVPKCLCKCNCRKKKRYVSMIKDDLSTVVRNPTSVAGMGRPRQGSLNAAEYTPETSFAQNQLLNALTEVSEMRLAIQMMERKMDSLLDKISIMSDHTLQSPTINYGNVPAVDIAADTVDDMKGFVHGTTRTEHSITKLTSDMALQTAKILALERAALIKQSQTDRRPSMVASSEKSKPLTDDIKVNHRILSLETKVHSLAKKNKEQKTERRELNKEEMKNMESKISSLRELIDTFMESQLMKETEIANGERGAEDSARKVVRLENIRDDYRNVSQEQFLAEMNKISKRVNAVSTNVSNACRSLSIGLNDVHKVALDLVNWSDEVHNAFAIITEKLFLSKNLCPRFYPSLRRVSSPLDYSPT